MREWIEAVRRIGIHAVGRVRADRRYWWIIGGGAAAVLALLAWAIWPASDPPEPRAREYVDFSVCVLTDSRGVSGPVAAPVWAGMQDASLATRVRVQWLAVAGEQTPANAKLFATSLAQSGCRVVFAAGELASTGAHEAAPLFPAVMFHLVGGGGTAPNVSTVDSIGDATVRTDVARIVTDAARSAGVI